MNFQQLRYFLVLAEEKNFSNAANLLFITQSTLSQSIANMERKLGVKLFIRSTNKVELTYAGEEYINTVRQILRLQSRFLAEHLPDAEFFDKGRLIVGVSFMRSAIYLPILIPKFAKKYPNIEIYCMEMTSENLDEATAKGYIDVSLHIQSAFNADVTYEPILEENFFVVAFPPDHPFRERITTMPQDFAHLPTVELSEIVNERFIYLKTGHRIRTLCDETFANMKIYPEISFVTDNILTALNFVSTGFGVTIIPQGIAQFAKMSPEPLYFKVSGCESRRWFVASYSKKTGLSNAGRAFINIAKQTLNSDEISNTPE